MIFRRTFVSELANSAGGVFTVLFSIVLTVGLVQILSDAVGGDVGSTTVFELVAYSSLVNMPPLLTVSIFIAVLMVMMRSWQDSEMIVWFSTGGRSLLSWIRPASLKPRAATAYFSLKTRTTKVRTSRIFS